VLRKVAARLLKQRLQINAGHRDFREGIAALEEVKAEARERRAEEARQKRLQRSSARRKPKPKPTASAPKIKVDRPVQPTITRLSLSPKRRPTTSGSTLNECEKASPGSDWERPASPSGQAHVLARRCASSETCESVSLQEHQDGHSPPQPAVESIRARSGVRSRLLLDLLAGSAAGADTGARAGGKVRC
jgi:hypothetical protein